MNHSRKTQASAYCWDWGRGWVHEEKSLEALEKACKEPQITGSLTAWILTRTVWKHYLLKHRGWRMSEMYKEFFVNHDLPCAWTAELLLPSLLCCCFSPLKAKNLKKKIASVSSKIGTTRYVLNNAQAKDVFIINFSSDGQFVPFHISAWIVQCCSSCSSESLSNDKIIVHRRLSAEMYQNFH